MRFISYKIYLCCKESMLPIAAGTGDSITIQQKYIMIQGEERNCCTNLFFCFCFLDIFAHQAAVISNSLAGGYASVDFIKILYLI